MAPDSSERRDTSCAAGTYSEPANPWDRARTGEQRPERPPSTPDDFAGYVRAMADEPVRRATLPVPGRRSWLTDVQGWLEPDAWERAVALVEEASALVHASARPPRTDGTLHFNRRAALFPLTDPPAPEEPR